MKLGLVLAIFFTVQAADAYYYYYPTTTTEKKESKYRYPYVSTRDNEKEKKFGEGIVASGFSKSYPESFIHVLKYCYGLSMDTNKIILRALTQENHLTIKRLDCYTVGLGNDLSKLEIEGQTALELAVKHENQKAKNYIEKKLDL
tara:strand:+ start:606 stop:1040 length:435 start_codon:yes stop_codon:yes gene_type:complete